MISIEFVDKEASGKRFLLKFDREGKKRNHLQFKKSYWNGKVYVGRYIEDFKGNRIQLLEKMLTDNSLSRQHFVLDFSRAFDKYLVPYKFILLVMCLKRKKIYICEDILRYMFSFIKKPNQVVVYPNIRLTKYIRIQDLGSTLGTRIRIKENIIDTGDKFFIGNHILSIEQVRHEANPDYEEHFFRGIEQKMHLLIHSDYIGNVIEDRNSGQQGECGFPFVRCVLNLVPYFLVATEGQYVFTIGRELESDIYLDVPELSRIQCRIIYKVNEKNWTIIDGSHEQPSLNGTCKIIKSDIPKTKSKWHTLEDHRIYLKNYSIFISGFPFNK